MRKLITLCFCYISLTAYAAKQKVLVEGMDCPSCVESISRAFKRSKYVKTVEVDVDSGEVVIGTVGEEKLSRKLIASLVKEAGFKVKK